MLDLKTLRLITRDGLQNFSAGRILDGIAALRTLLPYCPAETIVHAEAESLEENYQHMLTFLRGGGNDEKRTEVQAKIQRQGVALLQQASRAIRLIIADDHYSKAARQTPSNSPLGEGLKSPFNGDLEGLSFNGDLDEQQDNIFDMLWTSPLWSAQDTALWYDYIVRQRDMVQQHLEGALFLSLWEYYDAEKMQLLGLFADSECRRTRITAICYLLLLRLRHKELTALLPPLPDSLLSLKGRAAIAQVQYEMLLMLVSEKDMEKELKEAETLTKKVISNLSPSDNAMEKSAGEAFGAIKSIIALRGRYIRNRLQRGLDINLSKIPLLHGCEYLHRIAHWFLPFDKTHPLFQSVMIDEKGNEKQNLSTLVDLILDCDIDKLATLYLVANDKDFSKAVQHLDEQELPEVDNAVIPEYTFRFIMQDLFRFFGHSPLHSQLVNPFRMEETLLDLPETGNGDNPLNSLFSREDTVKCCELLYELGRDKQVLTILDKVIKREGASASALFLKGSTLRRQKQIQEAINCARSAEILEPDRADILRFLVECYATQNRFEEELEYLHRLAEILPDDRTLRRLIPITLNKLNKHEEALQLLFKLNYELEEDDEDYGTTLSLIADTAFSLGKLDIAERYTEKEMSLHQNGSAEGAMRMGHIKLLEGNLKAAIDHYEQFVNIFCKEKKKDIKVALTLLNEQWSNGKWTKDKQSDLLLIYDVLQASAK